MGLMNSVRSGYVAAAGGERAAHAAAAADELAERRAHRHQRAHEERAAGARDPRCRGAGAGHAVPVPRLPAPPCAARAEVGWPGSYRFHTSCDVS